MPFSGEVSRRRMYKRSPSGVVTFFGNIGTGAKRLRSIGGVVTFIGDITSLASQRLMEGVLRFSGEVSRIFNGLPVTPTTYRYNRNDCVLAVLGPGQYNELLLQFYLDNGATTHNLQDAEREHLIALGVPEGSTPDMWKFLLNALGYSGTLDDMLTEFWCNWWT